MEFKEDDPKRSKPTNHSPFPSTPMQHSTFSIPTLPPELITEIFSRLPVKSLLQFSCLSKYWLSVISSPQFINTHLTLSLNNKECTHHMLMSLVNPKVILKSCTLESLFCLNVTEAFDLDYPMKQDYLYAKCPKSDWILGSVNGLICVAAGKYDLFIGNPAIRKYKKLPDIRRRFIKFVRRTIYSFGYDEFHDDYKVVGVFHSYDSSDPVEVKVYSLENDSWTSVDDCPSEIFLNVSGKFVNGKLHWVTTAPGLDVYKGGNIYSFDLANEKWEKTVELPSYRGGEDSVLWLTVLANDLSVFCDYERTHLDVWVMKEYGVKESWTIKFAIKCPGDEVVFRDLFDPFNLLSFMSKKGEILVVYGSIAVIYNPNDESIRYSKVINFDDYYEEEIYVESLVSPFPTEEREDATKNNRLKNLTSNHSPCPSTSMQHSTFSIATLPPELITEIFSRLPIKSLLQLRCVSKYWLAVISSPQFISTHLSLSLNNKEYTHHMLISLLSAELTLKSCTLESLFYQNVTEAFDLDHPMKHDEFYTKLPRSDWILGSVNGLICLAAGKHDLFIGNPSIRKYKKLPDARPRSMKFVHMPMYSFGYDGFHDDYKVVGVYNSYDSSNQAEVKIYSLKNDFWRSVDDCPSEIRLNGSGKFVNGKLHWVTTARGLGVYKGGNIYSFDLADEKWEKTVEHPSYRGEYSGLWLTVLASELSIFCDYEGTQLDVWVMKEYGVKESWTIMFAIKCPGEEVVFRDLLNPLFFMSKKGEILVVFGSIAMIYNPNDESIRYSEVINFDGDYEVEIYVESLVSPFSTEERGDPTKNKRLKNLRSR